MSHKWIIVLLAFDDPKIEPQVLKEQIAENEDEHLAAFLRGGELLDIVHSDDEEQVEGYRLQIEKQCLRTR